MALKSEKGHGPVDPKVIDYMKALGAGIDDILNGKNSDKDNPKWGFALLVFPFGEVADGRVNYLSNAERETMIVAMKEFIARHEGRYFTTEGEKQ